MTKSQSNIVWEDREVLFDLPFAYLKLRPGEKIFDRIEPIEDTKGNSGTKGRMVVTNLRVIWHSLSSPRINLCIGLGCVLSTSTKVVNSGLRATTQALYILATYKNSRYEFIFTNLSPTCVRHYTSVVGVHKAYSGSRLYRDLRLRGAIINNKQLRRLALEKVVFLSTLKTTTAVIEQIFRSVQWEDKGLIINGEHLHHLRFADDIVLLSENPTELQIILHQLDGESTKILLQEQSIWNLSSESGNLGTLVVTDVRLVWYADINDAFNVSMPYITIDSIIIRESKFGEALVIAIRPTCGGYVLGFRADPRERLQPLLLELQALHQAYSEKPIFGVEMVWDNEITNRTTDDIEDLEEIGEPRGEMGPNLYLASKLANDKEEHATQPVHSSYLGLAIEPLNEGFTLKSLFEVQSNV